MRYSLITISTTAFLAMSVAGCGPSTQAASNATQEHVSSSTPPNTGEQAARWWKPTPGLSWQIQYSGAINLTLAVSVYNLDLFETPKTSIDKLHAQGKRVICYFGGGNWESWRPDAASFPAVVKGLDIEGWAGEKWLDIRRLDILRPLMIKRLDLAKAKGCDAVDPDVMDGWQARTGFPLTYAHQIAYNKMIAEESHLREMAVSLKNDLEQIRELLPYFDFAVNEECWQYRECDALKPFIAAGKPVYAITYKGDKPTICKAQNALKFDALFKRLSLDAWRYDCRLVQ